MPTVTDPATSPEEGIVILGCPRSGTTLLRRILDAHPSISAPGETYLLTSCARFLHHDRSVDGMKVGVINGLGFSGFGEEEIVHRLREFAFSFHREHCARQGKKRWAEKTAVDAFHVPEIERICGDRVRFVCVFRHGLDVVCSMSDWIGKLQSYPSELHPYIRAHPEMLVAFSHAWVDACQQLQAFVGRHPGDAIALRYEDLVSAPAQTMSRVFEFLGESWDASLLATAFDQEGTKGFSDWKTYSKSAVEVSSMERWKRLSQATLAGLVDIVNPTLVECGYDPIESQAGDSDEFARRRYELGLALQRGVPDS